MIPAKAGPQSDPGSPLAAAQHGGSLDQRPVWIPAVAATTVFLNAFAAWIQRYAEKTLNALILLTNLSAMLPERTDNKLNGREVRSDAKKKKNQQVVRFHRRATYTPAETFHFKGDCDVVEPPK